ncbi:MAG TPA: M48 family metalloprotease [Mycobacteriales bacterium]|nr:M48 family metalloprotease [Mycobacteriales bacterium]
MSRVPAAVTLVLLLVALGVALAVVVPWTPLPGADLQPDAARDFTAAERAREEAYSSSVRPPAYSSLGLGLLVAAVLGFTPLGARLVELVARPLGGGWAWRVLLGTIALTLVGRLVTLPLAARVEVVRRDVGLSTRDWTGWAADLGKGWLVSTVLTAVALLVLVALARAAPRTWWAWGAAATAALVVVVSFGYPVLVEPLFNRFTPLPAGELRDDLLELAERDGVPVEDVLVADASRRTTALNAYVSGFGQTRRIVVYDTLLESAPPEEVQLVVAHELAHAKHQDVLTGTLLGALGAAAAVVALALVLSWSPLLRLAGVEGPGDGRAVALVLALTALASFAVAPVSNLVSRRVEARADVSSLDLTRDVDTFVETQKRLARTNLSDLEPNPVAYALFATHPSTTERLSLAREWERLRS